MTTWESLPCSTMEFVGDRHEFMGDGAVAALKMPATLDVCQSITNGVGELECRLVKRL